VSLKDRLRNLACEAEEEMLVIPLQDGPVKRFPSSAGMEAYINLMERLGAGEEAPPEHSLIEAARNSSGSKWSESFYAVNDEHWTDSIKDLSD
jgi:hypothetical protein